MTCSGFNSYFAFKQWDQRNKPFAISVFCNIFNACSCTQPIVPHVKTASREFHVKLFMWISRDSVSRENFAHFSLKFDVKQFHMDFTWNSCECSFHVKISREIHVRHKCLCKDRIVAVHEQSTYRHMDKVVYTCLANCFWKETQYHISPIHF